MTVKDSRYPLRKRIIFMSAPFLLLLLILLFAELILRFTMPDLRYYYNAKGISGGIALKRNSLRMRDKEFPIRKTSNEYRILCVGDSTTFGAGEKLKDTWPKQLEKKLKLINSDIFVINGGGTGNHPHIALWSYLELHKEIDFDMYIFGFCMNDVLTKGDKWDQEKYMLQVQRNHWEKFKFVTRRFRSFLSRFYIIGFLQYILKRCDPTTYNSKYIIAAHSDGYFAFGVAEGYQQAWNDTFESLQNLNNLFKERSIKFAIVPIPYRFMISDDRRDNLGNFDVKSFKVNPINKLRNFCKEHNILFVESLTTLQSVRNQMLQGKIKYNPMYQDITMDYCHPNAYGYKIIADSAYQAIESLVRDSLSKYSRVQDVDMLEEVLN